MQIDLVGVHTVSPMGSKLHSHPQWEFIYNEKGSGTMTVGEERFPFLPGTVLLCPPGMLHDKVGKEGFTDYFIRFTGCDLPVQMYLLQDSFDMRLLQLMRVLHTTWYEECAPSVCHNLLEAMLGLVKPMLVGAEQSVHVRKLRQCIAQGYANPDFSLTAAMQSLSVDPDHLRRLFVRQTGQTPHAYLTALRLDKAKHLLTEEGSTVADVAYRCGFYDPLYFSRVFRKATGVPPSQWR